MCSIKIPRSFFFFSQINECLVKGLLYYLSFLTWVWFPKFSLIPLLQDLPLSFKSEIHGGEMVCVWVYEIMNYGLWITRFFCIMKKMGEWVQNLENTGSCPVVWLQSGRYLRSSIPQQQGWIWNVIILENELLYEVGEGRESSGGEVLLVPRRESSERQRAGVKEWDQREKSVLEKISST